MSEADLYRIAIVGMGEGGLPLAKLFHDDPRIKVTGVCDSDADKDIAEWARNMGIFTTHDYKELLARPDIDIVLNADGSDEIGAYLGSIGRTDVEVIRTLSAGILRHLVEDREVRERDAQISLVEQKLLYDIGIMLSNMDKSEQALKLIVEAAIDLLDMSAGSVALYDEENGVLTTAVSVGFQEEAVVQSWKPRQGGMTGHILSSPEPVAIGNLAEDNVFKLSTSDMYAHGVRSLIAVSLKAERKIVGVLYVDDFKAREFADRDKSQISLLGTMAAAAIEKLLMLERAEEMAIRDELTKIYNHRYLVRSMGRELKRAERYREDLSFCMIDVDYFKKFNDTHGHLQGNEVLIHVARILTETVRDSDVVARYGGEEFAVILPKTSKEMALNFAERLRHAVEAYPFPGRETQPNGLLSISVGVSSFPGDGMPIADVVAIIERADQALYHAKVAGRNRVVGYKEPA